MRRSAVRVAIVAVICTLAPVADAKGPSYTLAPRAQNIAVAPNGAIFVRTEVGAVERWQAGRVTPVYTSGKSVGDIAVGADGRLYATEGCRVVRIDAGNRLTTVAGGRRCSDERVAGPRPATAPLCGTGPLVPGPDTTLLLGEGCNGLVRLRPGATIEQVAGWPDDLWAPEVMAAMPDGSVAASSGGELYRVPPGGPLERLLDWAPTLLARVDDGLLLNGSDPGVVLSLLDSAGNLEPALRNRREDAGWDGDGEPVPGNVAGLTDIARAPDGGWLLAAGRLRYIPPAKPKILAVAIRRQALTSVTRPRVALSLTRSAAVTVEVLVDGRRRAIRHVRLGAGNRLVGIGGLSRRDVNVVRVVARAAGDRAEDSVSLLTGDLLPMQAAAFLVYQTTTVPTFYDWLVAGRLGCRRFGARRVDCAHVHEGGCNGFTAVRLRRDGRITVAFYDARNDERCEFRRRAVGRGSITAVPDLPEE